jgi:hypothetical protein
MSSGNGKSRVQLGGHADRDIQCRPPYHRSLDHLGRGMCRLATADHSKRAKRGSLFRHHAAAPEAGEAPAQRGKGRNGCGEPPSPRFGGEPHAVGEVGVRYRGDQGRVVHACRHERMSRAVSQGLLHPHAGVREKIELLFGHPIMMRAAIGRSNRARHHSTAFATGPPAGLQGRDLRVRSSNLFGCTEQDETANTYAIEIAI